MAEWQYTKRNLGDNALSISAGLVLGSELNDVGNDVDMRNHDCFLVIQLVTGRSADRSRGALPEVQKFRWRNTGRQSGARPGP